MEIIYTKMVESLLLARSERNGFKIVERRRKDRMERPQGRSHGDLFNQGKLSREWEGRVKGGGGFGKRQGLDSGGGGGAGQGPKPL